MFWKNDEYKDYELETTISVDEEEIMMVQPLINDDLTFNTTKSLVKFKNNSEMIANHPYSELQSYKKEITIKGFYNGN